MGWRERDWAKLDQTERRALFGSADRGRGAARDGRRFGVVPGAWLAILVSGTVFLLGQIPRNDPILPPLRIDLPSWPLFERSQQPDIVVGKLELPTVAKRGAELTVTGRAPVAASGRGEIVVHWNSRPWQRVGYFQIRGDGRFRAPITLTRIGMLNVRLIFPNGDRLVGAVRVRP